jgi:hypothetical protein
VSKSTVTAEEKERLRRQEMESLRNKFLQTRPENDKALETELRQQTEVPLSPGDLLSKETPKIFSPGSSTAQVPATDPESEEEQPQKVANPILEARGGERTKDPKPRFPTAGVLNPTTGVLFKELALQIKAYRTAEPGRRITVSVSEEVFSRVSHLHFVERIGKLEIMSYLMERFVPKERPEKLPRFLARELEDEDQPRHLTFFEDLELAQRLDWLKERHGFTKVAVVENIVLHVLPPAPFNVPPTKRRRVGLVSMSMRKRQPAAKGDANPQSV